MEEKVEKGEREESALLESQEVSKEQRETLAEESRTEETVKQDDGSSVEKEREAEEKRIRIAAFVLGLFILCVVLFGFSYCTGLWANEDETPIVTVDVADTSGGVAATVNGVEIGENAITNYVANFRYAHDLLDDDAWGEWLYDYGYTINSLRGETLEYLENQELMKQAANELGIVVNDGEIEAALQDVIDGYDSRSDFEAALRAAGMTEQDERRSVQYTLLNQAIMDALFADVVADDDAVLSYIKSATSEYADASSLDDVDPQVVSQARKNADNFAKQQAFNDYMNAFKKRSQITETFLPTDVPYNIDLGPYEEAAYAAAKEVQEARQQEKETTEG